MTTTAEVVVLGSLHYDIMVEAPDRPRKGETLPGRSWYPKTGGKGGNQAIAARRAGAGVAMIGAVGRDAFGAALLASLASTRRSPTPKPTAVMCSAPASTPPSVAWPR